MFGFAMDVFWRGEGGVRNDEGTSVDFPTSDLEPTGLRQFSDNFNEKLLPTLRISIKKDESVKVVSLLMDFGDFNVKIPEPRRRSASTSSNPADYNAPYECFWCPPIVLAAQLGSSNVLSQLVTFKHCDINAVDQKGQTALHYSIKRHRSGQVKLLLDHGADPNMTTPAGNTALILACSLSREDLETVKYIIKHSLDIDARRYLGKTALSIAATKGHRNIVKLLLDRGASIDPRGFAFGEDPFVDAARSNSLGVVQVLIERLDCETRHMTLNRALLAAVAGGADLVLVKYLVENGASVDAKSEEYQHTPLMEAIRCCRWQLLNYFIGELSANVSAQDCRGRTALHYSAEFGARSVTTRAPHPGFKDNCSSTDQMKVPPLPKEKLSSDGCHIAINLYKQGYDPFVFNKLGYSPLHLACMNGMTSLVQAILDDYPSRVDFKDGNKRTPLSYAVTYSNLATVHCVLTFGPNLDQPLDESGKTLLHTAANSCNPCNVHIIQALIQHGCNINSVDIIGQNAIHYAVASNQVQVLDILIKAGVSPDRVSQTRGAPIHIAAEYGLSQVMERLLDTEMVSVRQSKRPSFLPPLVLATRNGHIDCMKVLLEHDPSGVHIHCHDNTSVLDHYIQQGPHDLEVIQLLLDYGFNVRKHLEVCVLGRMIRNRHDRAVGMLVEAGAPVDKVKVTDLCPLWEALCTGNLPIVRCLLKAGCQVGDCLSFAFKRQYMGACWCLYQAGSNLRVFHHSESIGLIEKMRNDFSNRGWEVQLQTLSELEEMAIGPRSLQGMCRLTLRNYLCKDTKTKVASLPLPQAMKNYILLQDLDSITHI